MAALPTTTDAFASGATEAQFKTFLIGQRNYLVGLFGADGVPSTAKTALGISDGVTSVNGETGDVTVPGVPVGSVVFVASSTAPSGYLKATGALVSRATYSALFAVIGTTFGAGDGSTTFAIPDLRGEFLRGLDDGRGIDSGRALGSLQADEYKSHTHQIGVGTAAGGSAVAAPSNGTYLGPQNTTSSGGGETRPRNVALSACIKF